MLFKSEQIRFVEMDQTLASQAVFASEMNNSTEPQPQGGFDPFAGGPDFGAPGYGGADFGNPADFGAPDIR